MNSAEYSPSMMDTKIRIFYSESFGDFGRVDLSFVSTLGEFLALLLMGDVPASPQVLNLLGIQCSPELRARWKCSLSVGTLRYEEVPKDSTLETIPWEVSERVERLVNNSLSFGADILRHLHKRNWDI